MDDLFTHLQHNAVAYIILAALLIPVLWFTRRYSMPPIQWTIELCIYAAIFHVIMHGIVALTAWFREESQMQAIKDQRQVFTWTTPLYDFWKRSLYNPTWIFYFEVAMVILAIILMIRLRPMKRQKPLPKRDVLTKGMSRGMYRPGSSIRPRR